MTEGSTWRRQPWTPTLLSAARVESDKRLNQQWLAARRRHRLLLRAQEAIERLIDLCDALEGDPDFEDQHWLEDGDACEDEGDIEGM